DVSDAREVEGECHVRVTDPRGGEAELDIARLESNTLSGSFIPRVPGSYKISFRYGSITSESSVSVVQPVTDVHVEAEAEPVVEPVVEPVSAPTAMEHEVVEDAADVVAEAPTATEAEAERECDTMMGMDMDMVETLDAPSEGEESEGERESGAMSVAELDM
ncbi:hypothetical protein KIPB_013266, partial [Kipferlia bialata]